MKANELTINNEKLSDIYGDIEIEYYDTVSRMKGTGYRNSIYRVVGTDDAIILKYNNGCIQNIFETTTLYEEGYFADRRNYAKIIGKLCKEFPAIPFNVGLVLGTDRDVWVQVEQKKQEYSYISEWTPIRQELICGINRRKRALLEILERDLYEELNVSSMGQRNSSRLAHFFANIENK